MNDLSGGSHILAENVRALAQLVRSRRDTLGMTGEVALVLAAASSAATLLGVRGAPPGSFVVQCFALGLLALTAIRTQPLRAYVPALSIAAAASLVVIVALEAVRSGGAVIPLAVAVAAAVIAGAGIDARRGRNARRELRLRRTMARERRVMQARAEMVANLSHDLRNPLAIALGFSEMAEDDDLPTEERLQALSGLRRSLCEMSQLVENVLEGSADQAGALSTSPEPLDLAGVCEDALAATAILLRRRPIELEGRIEPGILVLADRQRLARVLGNLLGNACKYTAAGEIRLHALSDGRCALIRVEDTGAGIAPEAVPFIFDRFRRAHQGGAGGVGLGLAIAHRLVEHMGGTLEVATELGVGSTFTITLPLAEAERGESVAA